MNKRLFWAMVVAVAVGFLATQVLRSDSRDTQLNRLNNELKDIKAFSGAAVFQIQNSDILTEDEKNQYGIEFLSFDVAWLKTQYQALITAGIYKTVGLKKHGKLDNQKLDPLVATQLTLLEHTGKTPLQFVDEMLPMLTNSVNELQKRREELEKKLNLKLS